MKEQHESGPVLKHFSLIKGGQNRESRGQYYRIVKGFKELAKFSKLVLQS